MTLSAKKAITLETNLAALIILALSVMISHLGILPNAMRMPRNIV